MKGDPKKGKAFLDRMASGREFDKMDKTPVEMPFGMKRPSSLADLVARMVKQAVEAEADEEFETWEEADDFEEEDPDTVDLSPYTFEELEDDLGSAVVNDDPPEPPEPPPEPSSDPPQPPTGDPPDPNAQEPG